MNRQRGFVWWIYLIAAGVILAALAWSVHAVYDSGREAERTIWQQRENELNAKAAENMRLAQEKLIALERAHAAQLAQVSAGYQAQLKENENAKQRVIAGLRDGTRKLYVNAKCPDTGNTGAAVSASAGRRDGDARAELSGPAAEFLVSLANEADAVVRQLAACQSVITADRKR